MLKDISWSRGFFRLWIVYGVIVVIITSVNIYDETPYMPKRKLSYSEKTGNFFDTGRFKITGRDDADGSGWKGYKMYEIGSDTLGFPEAVPKKTVELKLAEYRNVFQARYDSRLLDERIEIATIGLSFLFVPLLIALIIKWILMGFRKKTDAL
jgi:hypothetical protein